MDNTRFSEQLPTTENGGPLVECTSYYPSGEYWTPVYPQIDNNIPSREEETPQTDYPIQMMLHDDQMTASGSNETRERQTTDTSDTGISEPTYSRTGTTCSTDDINVHLSRLSITSTTSNESEDDLPRRKVPELRLRELSSKVGREWEKLASFLNFDRVAIERFKYNQADSLEDQIFLMLTTWRCLRSNRATSRVLANALRKAGRKDLADEMFDSGQQLLQVPRVAKRVPNQMFNNLLADLCELTETDRCKIAILIRKDNLTGDGANLEGRDGKPPDLLDIISCLEVNNYLDANNVWYLQYLLLQLKKKELYQKVWDYAAKRFKKHKTLYLHEPSFARGKNHATIRYKIAGTVEHFGGMHLDEFKEMLATKFDGEVRHISSVGAKRGCIELFFQMPIAYKEKALQAAKEEAEWLLEKKVISVQVMGEDHTVYLSTEHHDCHTAELAKEMLLLECIVENDKQGLEQLLTDGACPNFKVGGKWLLQWAIFMDREEDREEFVQLLLEHGADRDAKDEMNMSAVEESAFLGRCRQTLTFTPVKPVHTYLKKEEEGTNFTFVPKLTADNLQIYSVFVLEKRQFACLPCKKIWQERVWGYKPGSRCKECGMQYQPMLKGKECPRRRVWCETCDLVFTSYRHPSIPKHCRYCHSVVVDCPPNYWPRSNKMANGRTLTPLPRLENVGNKFLEAVLNLDESQ